MGDTAENTPEEIITDETIIDGDGQQEIEEPELFLEGEDETHKSSDSVPVAAHINLKKKLKGELREKDQNLEAIKQELELYKLKEKQQSVAKDDSLSFPNRKDFDFDDDAYEAAVQTYQANLQKKISESTSLAVEQANQQISAIRQSDAEKQQEKLFDDALIKSVKQVEEYGLKNYNEAAESVANSMPGDAYKILLSQGIIDAKTTYYLHKNPAKLKELLTIADTQGDSSAVAKLTEIRLGLKSRKQQSPPDPDTPTSGTKGAGSNKFQAQLDKERNKPAHEVDMQKIINLKRQAREAGASIN